MKKLRKEVESLKKEVESLKEWQEKEEILGKAMRIEIKRNVPKLIERMKNELGINTIQEVLKKFYKQEIEKGLWAIKCVDPNEDDNGRSKSMTEFIEDDINFYKDQLKKLNKKRKKEKDD